MKTASDVYNEYKIMPSLQLHQLRVAAVAKMVCDASAPSIDTEAVILECLFHDMGNIVKSDLAYFPEFTEPQGIEYWEEVKKKFIARYGSEQHAANAAIAREIGLPERVIALMDQTGFSKLRAVKDSASLELRICQYADLRVGPHGILSLEERLAEGRERYVALRKGKKYYDNEPAYTELLRAAVDLEKGIFARASIKPEVITDTSASSILEELRKYPVA